jgi:hypothetical protein
MSPALTILVVPLYFATVLAARGLKSQVIP